MNQGEVGIPITAFGQNVILQLLVTLTEKSHMISHDLI